MFHKELFYVNATKVEIARGLSMPFLPIVPALGSPIRTRTQISKTVKELENENLLIHPSIKGVRVCLAVVDRNVFIHDQRGRWITVPPKNGRDFLKLPNNTCLDGYIAFENFYPSDCAAIGGKSLRYKTALEREAVAYQLVKFLGHQWLFRRPSVKFIKDTRKNLPNYQGLLFKDYMSFYAILSAKTQTSKEWLERQW